MILDISDFAFRRILNDDRLFLPIRWNGGDFLETLRELYSLYIRRIKNEKNSADSSLHDIGINFDDIYNCCRLIEEAVSEYLQGYPSDAFNSIDELMPLLMGNALKLFYKNGSDFEAFRVVQVDENKVFGRERVFHTPYTLRSKVSTSRYSIAGYPSLYLATSLELCCEEISLNPYDQFALASLFKINSRLLPENVQVECIDLGIKPQDFLDDSRNEGHRYFGSYYLRQKSTKEAYLLWYPLIAASSYIRVSKSDPFSAEYIIPQLLMQWVRRKISGKGSSGYTNLLGIRYFSCSSIKSSDMGFNYVFPTSGEKFSSQYPYCPVLIKSFSLTRPQFIHEFADLAACERELKRCGKYDLSTISAYQRRRRRI